MFPYGTLDNWVKLSQKLSNKAKKNLFIEVIFMTYSFVQRAINNEAFPNAVELYDKALMTGRGCGKYCYRDEFRVQAEPFLKAQISNKLGNIPIIYIV